MNGIGHRFDEIEFELDALTEFATSPLVPFASRAVILS